MNKAYGSACVSIYQSETQFMLTTYTGLVSSILVFAFRLHLLKTIKAVLHLYEILDVSGIQVATTSYILIALSGAKINVAVQKQHFFQGNYRQ